MAQRIGVAGIIPRDGRVLVLRRAADERFLPGFFDLPGGGLEPGELPEDGVLREVLEETGLPTSVVRILSVRPYTNRPGQNQPILITFLLRLKDAQGHVKLSEEHDEYRWVERSELDSVFREGQHLQTSDPDLIRGIIQEYFESDSN